MKQPPLYLFCNSKRWNTFFSILLLYLSIAGFFMLAESAIPLLLHGEKTTATIQTIERTSADRVTHYTGTYELEEVTHTLKIEVDRINARPRWRPTYYVGQELEIIAYHDESGNQYWTSMLYRQLFIMASSVFLFFFMSYYILFKRNKKGYPYYFDS